MLQNLFIPTDLDNPENYRNLEKKEMRLEEASRLNQLLNDAEFGSEITIYNRAYQRLKIRLRNNQLIAKLKQLKNRIKRLRQNHPANLFSEQTLASQQEKQKQVTVRHTFQLVSDIDSVLNNIIAIYRDTEPHFRLGHLVQHFIVIRSTVARLAYCFKALLVYSADLYLKLVTTSISNDSNSKTTKRERGVLSYDKIKIILTKHNCKPRDLPKPESETELEVVFEGINSEKIGQIIDRSSLRPRRSSRKD